MTENERTALRRGIDAATTRGKNSVNPYSNDSAEGRHLRELWFLARSLKLRRPDYNVEAVARHATFQ